MVLAAAFDREAIRDALAGRQRDAGRDRGREEPAVGDQCLLELDAEVPGRRPLGLHGELVFALAEVLLDQEVPADAVGGLAVEREHGTGAHVALGGEQAGGLEAVQRRGVGAHEERCALGTLHVEEGRRPRGQGRELGERLERFGRHRGQRRRGLETDGFEREGVENGRRSRVGHAQRVLALFDHGFLPGRPAIDRNVDQGPRLVAGSKSPALIRLEGGFQILAGSLCDGERLGEVEGQRAQHDAGANAGLVVEVGHVVVVGVESHPGEQSRRPQRGLLRPGLLAELLEGVREDAVRPYDDVEDAFRVRKHAEHVESGVKVPGGAARLRFRALVMLGSPGEEGLDAERRLDAAREHLVASLRPDLEENGHRVEQVAATRPTVRAVDLYGLVQKGLAILNAVGPASHDHGGVHGVLGVPGVHRGDPVIAGLSKLVRPARLELLEDVWLSGFCAHGHDAVVVGRLADLRLGGGRQRLLCDLCDRTLVMERTVRIGLPDLQLRGPRLGQLDAEVRRVAGREEPVVAERSDRQPLAPGLREPRDAEPHVQRMLARVLRPGLAGAAVRGDQVQPGFEVRREAAHPHWVPLLRLDRLPLGVLPARWSRLLANLEVRASALSGAHAGRVSRSVCGHQCFCFAGDGPTCGGPVSRTHVLPHAILTNLRIICG